MPTDYSLADLAQLAGVTPRTIRYYIAQGLLPSPGQIGPGVRYGEAHLARLRLVRRLQREHQPLATIRARLADLSDHEVGRLVADVGAEPGPPSTALQYVQELLRGTRGRSVMPASLSAMTMSTAGAASPRRVASHAAVDAPAVDAPAVPPPAVPPPAAAVPFHALAEAVASVTTGPAADPVHSGATASAGPLRSQWERIGFGPDVEIHVRRPLAPGDVRRLERLIAFARQLFEGDQP